MVREPAAEGRADDSDDLRHAEEDGREGRRQAAGIHQVQGEEREEGRDAELERDRERDEGPDVAEDSSDLPEGPEPVATRCGALMYMRRYDPEEDAEDDRRGREPDV